jgi:hypothetical protein
VGEPDRAPDLRDVYDSINAGWRRDACRGDDALFLSDRALGKPKNLGSPTLPLALAICSTCEVRRECLAEGLRDIRIDLAPLSDAHTRPSATVPADGIWGGSTTFDRARVRDLPRAEALARLGRSFPDRLQRSLSAFRRRSGRMALGPRGRRLVKMVEDGDLAAQTVAAKDAAAPLPALARSDARYCGIRCRVAAHRARVAA